MKPIYAAIALTVLALWPVLVRGADDVKPKVEMGRMQMVLLSRPANATSVPPDTATLTAQRKATDALLLAGKLVFAGDCTGDGALRAVLILKSAETNDARELAASLPAVKSGAWKAEQLLWFGPVNLIKPASAAAPATNYIFGLLLRGTNAAKLPAEEVAKIQEGHMANIRRLGEEGKLSIAGPFVEGGDRRGIFVFKVGSVAEAQRLADTDPAVIAGRLRIVLHPMLVPGGILP